ncbi:MAG: hypothetical protein M3297_06020 [Thermoproteota archaeon]|nr:hypothetical protein [Thermoproteota archaeon]
MSINMERGDGMAERRVITKGAYFFSPLTAPNRYNLVHYYSLRHNALNNTSDHSRISTADC